MARRADALPGRARADRRLPEGSVGDAHQARDRESGILFVTVPVRSVSVIMRRIEADGRDDVYGLDAKLEHLLAEMKANQAFLIYSLNIDKRVEAIERKTADSVHAS